MTPARPVLLAGLLLAGCATPPLTPSSPRAALRRSAPHRPVTTAAAARPAAKPAAPEPAAARPAAKPAAPEPAAASSAAEAPVQKAAAAAADPASPQPGTAVPLLGFRPMRGQAATTMGGI